MLTVTRIARQCGISRTTVLYYESIGLLRRPARTGGNYRLFGQADLERLTQIRAYRDAGLGIVDIRELLDSPGGNACGVLKRRLLELDAEIGDLRGHQHAILRLMQQESFRKDDDMTKQKWVAIMHAAGLTEDQMLRWHMEFERAAPEEHREFLEYLHIGAEEIGQIRERSRKGF